MQSQRAAGAAAPNSDEDGSGGLVAPRQARRAHTKTKTGCQMCKRRKIKCDEGKPDCANCLQFRVPCDFNPEARTAILAGDAATSASPPPGTRRRGRPRKDWAALSAKVVLANAEPTPTSSIPASGSPASAVVSGPSLSYDSVELLLHFIRLTGPSLSPPDDLECRTANFWANNVPQIGLIYPHVMHLALGLSGYHMVYRGIESTAQRQHLWSLAEHHTTTGLTEFSRAMSGLDATNCGAMYISSMLVCHCAFAVGPQGPDDLLICHVAVQEGSTWLPLARGVRLVMQSFGPDTLYTGLMRPLHPSVHARSPKVGPTISRDDPAWLDWTGHLGRLREFVASRHEHDNGVCERTLGILEMIYRGTYGDANGAFEGSDYERMVLSWLYLMEVDFTFCLQRQEPGALLILAYFAPLLKTLDYLWLLDRWSEHILVRVEEMVGVEFGELMRWPKDVVWRNAVCSLNISSQLSEDEST